MPDMMEFIRLMRMDLMRNGNFMEVKKTTTSTRMASPEKFLRFPLTILTSFHTLLELLRQANLHFQTTVRAHVEEAAPGELRTISF